MINKSYNLLRVKAYQDQFDPIFYSGFEYDRTLFPREDEALEEKAKLINEFSKKFSKKEVFFALSFLFFFCRVFNVSQVSAADSTSSWEAMKKLFWKTKDVSIEEVEQVQQKVASSRTWKRWVLDSLQSKTARNIGGIIVIGTIGTTAILVGKHYLKLPSTIMFPTEPSSLKLPKLPPSQITIEKVPKLIGQASKKFEGNQKFYPNPYSIIKNYISDVRYLNSFLEKKSFQNVQGLALLYQESQKLAQSYMKLFRLMKEDDLLSEALDINILFVERIAYHLSKLDVFGLKGMNFNFTNPSL